jgi:hypothetical protein
MRLPARTTSNVARLTFARYVARRLRRARLTDEEGEVRAATTALSEASGALGEAELAVSDWLADRDAADDDLDDTARRSRGGASTPTSKSPTPTSTPMAWPGI